MAASVAPPVLCKPKHRVDRASRLIELGPGEDHPHSATVLVLHGFGDTAAGWFEPALFWAERLPHVRFVLPTAPISQEMGTTAWFSFGGASMQRSFDESVNSLQALLQKEERLVGTGRLAIIGFSQGGALAYHFALNPAGMVLAGVAALSTFLRKETLASASVPVKQTPVLICHGEEDDRIPGGVRGAERAKEQLLSKGLSDVELKVYKGMGHSACDEELLDVLHWLSYLLPGADVGDPTAKARL